MSSDIATIFGIVQSTWGVIENSALFSVLIWFLGAYGIVLLVDIILLMFLRDIPGDLKKTMYGAQRPIVSHSKFQKRWEKLRERIDTGNPSQYKAALLEADALAEEMVAGIGYEGTNMAERLAAIREGHLLSLEGLKSAHAVRNRIIRDPDFVLSKEDAESFLSNYRKFFEELELL